MTKTGGKRVLAVLLCCVVCLTATACGARRSKYGTALRLPLAAEPLQLDPQMAQDAASVEVLAATMEGLTRLSEDGKPIAGIAASWTVSEDACTYTFTLRDAMWSNGEKVTADDFVFAVERGKDPATRSPLAALYKEVKTATAKDSRTLTVTLTAPDGAFLEKTASNAFFPCHRGFFEKSAGHYGMEQEYTLSNGAFMLNSWSHGEYLILCKNTHYYAADTILPDRMRYVLGTDEQDVVRLLKSGGLDAAALTDEQAADAARQGCTIETVYDSVYGLWLNPACAALKSEAVRATLCAALDRQKLSGLWEKENKHTATGFVAPDVRCGGEPYVRETDTFGSVKAGKTPNMSGLSQLTLLCGEDELSVALAKEILQTWQKKFSLYLKIEKLSASALRQRVEAGEYDLVLCARDSGGETVGQALAALSDDTAFTAALEAAEKTGKRADYQKAEARLYRVLPCLPFYYPARSFAFAEGVQGVIARPFGGGAFGAIYDFREATK